MLLLIFFWVVTPPVEKGKYTVASGGPHGLLALTELYKHLGYNVQPWRESFADLFERTMNSKKSMLVIISGGNEQLVDLESPLIAPWLEKGNSLLVVGKPRKSYLPFPEPFTQNAIHGAFKVNPTTPILQGVNNLLIETGSYIDKSWRKIRKESICDDTGCLFATRSVGTGRAFIIADPWLHTNRYISKADNALLLVRIAEQSNAQQIWIPEPAPPAKQALPQNVSPFPTTGMAHLLGFSVIGLWALGRRFGPPRVKTPRGSKAIREYVGAVAGLYRKGRKRKLVLQVIYDDLLHAASQAISGANPDEAKTAVAIRGAVRSGIPAATITKTIERCEDALSKKSLSEQELLLLVTDIDQIRHQLR